MNRRSDRILGGSHLSHRHEPIPVTWLAQASETVAVGEHVRPTLPGSGGGGGRTLYGATGGFVASDLYTIDPATGEATSIGPTGFAVTGMAYDHTTSTMYGATSSRSEANPASLITIDLATGAGSVIGVFDSVGHHVCADIACDSAGNLYGWLEGPDALASIDKTTGAATAIGPSHGTYGDGMDFDPGDVLYDMSEGNSGPLWTVDTTTGAVTTVATLSSAPGSDGDAMAAASFNGATLYAVVADFGTAAWLVTVDTATGEVTTIGQSLDHLDALAWV